MIQILEKIGVVKNENSGDSFRSGPAIVLFLLLLTFIASTIYILVSSLD